MATNEQDRGRSAVKHTLCDTAEHQSHQACASMRSHDNEIGLPSLRFLHDRVTEMQPTCFEQRRFGLDSSPLS